MTNQDSAKGPGGFAEQASTGSQGVFGEFVDFLRHNKKWWLTPIILALLAFGVLLLVGGSVAAPFIYTLF